MDLKLALDKITVSGEDFYAENVSTLFSGIKATIADDVITERVDGYQAEINADLGI